MSQQLTCNDEIGITSNQPIISQNQHENDKENDKESRYCSLKAGLINMILLI